MWSVLQENWERRRSSFLSTAVMRSSTRQMPIWADETGRSSTARSSTVSAGALEDARRRGECILYLQSVEGLPSSKGRPAVRAWGKNAQGALIGKVVEWSAKAGCQSPAWYCAQPLGFVLKEHPDAMIHVEIIDRGSSGKLETPRGTVEVPLNELRGQGLCTHEVVLPVSSMASLVPLLLTRQKDPLAPTTVSMQIVDSNEVLEPRVVFFVRHGESTWNEAQDRLDVGAMIHTTNHPLSRQGREQAEGLSRRLMGLAEALRANNPKKGTLNQFRSAPAPKRSSSWVSTSSFSLSHKLHAATIGFRGEGEDEAVSKHPRLARGADLLLRPDVLYVSPLTRAVQTAAIAFWELQAHEGVRRELVFMPNAREQQKFGGRDTKSSVRGLDVIQRSLNELRALYSDVPDSPVVDNFKKLKFDVQEVQDQWWTVDSKESDAQLAARLNDFMSQLLFSPHRVIVVVGHSFFFRAVFKKYLSSSFKAKRPFFAAQLQTKKLMNCGIARVEMAPREMEDGPITDVELVLDSELVPSAARRWCFCCRKRRMKVDGVSANSDVQTE